MFGAIMLYRQQIKRRPHAIAYVDDETLTGGYVIYAIVGLLFSRPSPMIAIYIISKRHNKISKKQRCLNCSKNVIGHYAPVSQAVRYAMTTEEVTERKVERRRADFSKAAYKRKMEQS